MSEKKFLAGFGVANITPEDSVPMASYGDLRFSDGLYSYLEAVGADVSYYIPSREGEGYGMKAWGGAIAEWNEQAASFAAYITGKTAADVAGIAVDETTKPTDADLLTSVTIKIGEFQALIAKACN